MADPIGSSTFFNKTYDDALTLLVEARNYIAFQESNDCRQMDPAVRLLVSQETMRVTCRLTQVVAWMLCQRAVRAGEMTIERALSNEFAIAGEEVCLDDRRMDDDRIPAAVRGLLDRSLRLYIRVRRLDEMLRQSVASEA